MQEDYSLIPEELRDKFQEWFGDTVPPDMPLPTEADYIPQRKRVDNLPGLLDLASFGCGGAVLVGAVVGFIILMLSLNIYRRYINDWTDQLIVLSFALAFGFLGGLFLGKEALYNLDDRNLFKNEL